MNKIFSKVLSEFAEICSNRSICKNWTLARQPANKATQEVYTRMYDFISPLRINDEWKTTGFPIPPFSS